MQGVRPMQRRLRWRISKAALIEEHKQSSPQHQAIEAAIKLGSSDQECESQRGKAVNGCASPPDSTDDFVGTANARIRSGNYGNRRSDRSRKYRGVLSDRTDASDRSQPTGRTERSSLRPALHAHGVVFTKRSSSDDWSHSHRRRHLGIRHKLATRLY